MRVLPDPVCADVVKGEFTNIGVLLREVGRHDGAVVRFTRDWSRVRCMDADADVSLLEGLEAEIAARMRMEATDLKPVMEVFAGHTLQLVADYSRTGLSCRECADRAGAVDEDVCRAVEGESRTEANRQGGYCGDDADGV